MNHRDPISLLVVMVFDGSWNQDTLPFPKDRLRGYMNIESCKPGCHPFLGIFSLYLYSFIKSPSQGIPFNNANHSGFIYGFENIVEIIVLILNIGIPGVSNFLIRPISS